MEKDIWKPLKENPDIQILGLDIYDGSLSKLNFFRNFTSITFPLLLRASKVGKAYGVGTTDLFVVDRSGIIQLQTDIAETFSHFKKAQELIHNLVHKNPIFTLSSSALYFGKKIYIGESKSLQIEIRNTGSFELQITGFRSNTTEISIKPESLAIPGGQNRKVTIMLTPEKEGTLLGEVELLHPHVTLGQIKIPLLEIRVEESLSPLIALPLNRIHFDGIQVGSSIKQEFTIRNNGTRLLKVNEIRCKLSNIQISENTFTIQAGSEHTITVIFSPQTTKDFASTLDIISNDPYQPTLTVSLIGTAKITLVDPRADFNGNGKVDFTDFLTLVKFFNTVYPALDLDDSGLVDFGDFLIFSKSFGKPVN